MGDKETYKINFKHFPFFITDIIFSHFKISLGRSSWYSNKFIIYWIVSIKLNKFYTRTYKFPFRAWKPSNSTYALIQSMNNKSINSSGRIERSMHQCSPHSLHRVIRSIYRSCTCWEMIMSWKVQQNDLSYHFGFNL